MVRVLIRLVCPYCGELQWRVAEMGFWELRQLRKLLKNVKIDGKKLGDYVEIAEGRVKKEKKGGFNRGRHCKF